MKRDPKWQVIVYRLEGGYSFSTTLVWEGEWYIRALIEKLYYRWLGCTDVSIHRTDFLGSWMQ